MEAIKQLTAMASLAELFIKNAKNGEGFGLDEEQKIKLKEKLKEQGTDAQIESTLSEMKSKMNELKIVVDNMSKK